MLGYLKFYDDEKPDEALENYYMEREWRMFDNLEFKLTDIYRVILPESYASRFRHDFPCFERQLTFAPEINQKQLNSVAFLWNRLTAIVKKWGATLSDIFR